MSKTKLLIIAITLALLISNSVIAPAVAAGSAIQPQPYILNLKAEISPLTIYPPLVVFTATLNRLPPIMIESPAVEYYLVSPTVCSASLMRSIACNPKLVYMGSAPLNSQGQAIYTKQLYPGSYAVIARITYNGITTWSNEVAFNIP